MSNTHALADNLGADEPQAIHLGVRDFALRTQPQYEADDGPLTVAHSMVRAAQAAFVAASG
jgi:hypothetical protein